MTKIRDLMPLDLLQEMITDGMVKMNMHQSEPLTILNYTAKAQYTRTWNEVTRQCRGLIADLDSNLVARGFPKFFNLGELTDEEVPTGPFTVMEKLDGSLGILYPTADGWAVSTRGSFHSEQAQHATDLLRARYRDWQPDPALTYLFEIIYPKNRIVVDYGATDDLVLLDVLDTETGASVMSRRGLGWPGPEVADYPPCTLDELLAKEQPSNSEGYVLRFDSGQRVKVKHDEYVRLHRLVTGVSARTIWEYLSEGKPLDELLNAVPDEFYDWVQATAQDLHEMYDEVLAGARVDFDWAFGSVKGHYPDDQIRKAFALEAVKSEYKPLLFAMYDDKNLAPMIWKQIKPEAERPFAAQSEDAA